MKSILTLFFSLSVTLIFAQSLSINVSDVAVAADDGVHEGDIIITNISTEAVTLNTIMDRVCLNSGDDIEVQVCFGDLCFFPTNDETSSWNNVVTLAPGETSTNFKMVLDPSPVFVSEWNMTFFKNDNADDKVELRVVIGEGVLDACNNSVSTKDFAYTIGKAYPNPAADFINISYQIDVNEANLNIYNAIGMIVETVTVNPQSESVAINVADYVNGVYFYNVTDGKGQSKMMSFVK